MVAPQPTTATLHGRFFRAWAKLREDGVVIAASVQNKQFDSDMIPVVIVVEHPRDSNYETILASQ